MIQRFKHITVISLLIILAFLGTEKSFAVSQISKNLNLLPGDSHFLIFDEKIIRYKFENEKLFHAEILSNIFNNRQELLIKPTKSLDNKLTVWTASKIYNFNIQFKQNVNEINADINKLPLSAENIIGMEDFDLDIPPKLSK